MSAEALAALTRIFEQWTMRGVQLRNRLVFAGHGSRFVDPHNHQLTERQAQLPRGASQGWRRPYHPGLGHLHPMGMASGGINQVWDDSCIPTYARVADAVHEHGAAIFGQLSHLGRQGSGFPS